MKTKINAEVVADSIDNKDNRLTSLLITFPRIIIAEMNTHRMLVKNTSSSRAIPFNKMVEAIKEDPFIPVAWQKHHSGMQGSEYFTEAKDIELAETEWNIAKEEAINSATALYNRCGVTKQLCNRLLEPFMWTTMLITGSKEGWDNFFSLRCPSYEIDLPISNSRGEDWKTFKFKSRKELKKQVYSDEIDNYSDLEWLSINKGQAEIHMMALAEAIYDAMNESKPEELSAGECHIPFKKYLQKKGLSLPVMLKCSVAMAARTSYTVFEDSVGFSEEKLVNLYERLIEQDPPHSSPFEHVARALDDQEFEENIKGRIEYLDEDLTGIEEPLYSAKGWVGPYKGFMSYRYMLENNLR